MTAQLPPDAKIECFYKDAAGVCLVAWMHQSDYREAKRIEPDLWSRSPWPGLLQICLYAPHGERIGTAIQTEAGGPFIIHEGPFKGQRVDPKTGHAIGPAVAAAVSQRLPEQSPDHPALFPREWQNLVGTDGPAN